TAHPHSVRWATAWDHTEVALWASAADDLCASEWAFVDAVWPRGGSLPADPDTAADVQRLAELADAALPTTLRAVSQLGVADLLAPARQAGVRTRPRPELLRVPRRAPGGQRPVRLLAGRRHPAGAAGGPARLRVGRPRHAGRRRRRERYVPGRDPGAPPRAAR